MEKYLFIDLSKFLTTWAPTDKNPQAWLTRLEGDLIWNYVREMLGYENNWAELEAQRLVLKKERAEKAAKQNKTRRTLKQRHWQKRD